MAQASTSSGVHPQDGSEQPGDSLECLLVVRLALASSHQLEHSLSSKLAPGIGALCLDIMLCACCCGLQRCFSKPDTACAVVQ